MPPKKGQKKRKGQSLATDNAVKARKIEAERKKRQRLYDRAIRFYLDGHTYGEVEDKYDIPKATFSG